MPYFHHGERKSACRGGGRKQVESGRGAGAVSLFRYIHLQQHHMRTVTLPVSRNNFGVFVELLSAARDVRHLQLFFIKVN